MKASELVNKLQELIEEHGDHEVVYYFDNYYCDIPVEQSVFCRYTNVIELKQIY